MLKSEIVYRELLESPDLGLTQLGLAKRLGFSLSTVNNALKPLVAMGAVKVLPRGLRVTDRKKLLLYWASVRDMEKDVVYSTRAEGLPSEIEKCMPADVIYTAYSAYKFRFGTVPADYSEVYVYSEALEEIRKRFPAQHGPQNLFVLRMDRRLAEISKENIAPNSQVFVDLWNIREWYASEYVKDLGARIYG
ncbi:MAG: winged helix-turn-helix domain-containing protein [Candidatus Thermoplasmatota archaeon]